MIASRRLESRVTIAGFRENPYPWYANAAALVLTSDFEGMPNVLVEALACGTPVVSTDCASGPREVLTGSMSRFLVPPGDTDAIAARLREVVQSRPNIDRDVIAPFRHDKVLAAVESLAGAS
jgi:glycosyltransferase involved in cell wall biosynthesis